MTVYVRETKPMERFTTNDLWIAWFAGEAAGQMAETKDAAVTKLIKQIEVKTL